MSIIPGFTILIIQIVINLNIFWRTPVSFWKLSKNYIHTTKDHKLISVNVPLLTFDPNNLVINSFKSRCNMVHVLQIYNKYTFTRIRDCLKSHYCHQINGSPMGSPLFPLFAKIVKSELEKSLSFCSLCSSTLLM